MGKASRKKKQKDVPVKSVAEDDLRRIKESSYASRILISKYFHILLIVSIGILAYSNTFDSPFVFDDPPNISENSVIKDIGNFTSSSKGYEHNPRRFIGYLTFALNYHFGGLDVTGYHIVNLIIHIANAILVYFLVLLTFRTPVITQFSANTTMPINIIALFSSLLFVSHPIQTQAVTYIVQRFASLATLFYIFSVVMYIKARLAGSQSGRIAGYSLSLISAIYAMMTKEISFTLPLIIVLYEFIFFKSTHRKRLLFLLPVVLTIIIIPLSIIGTDKPLGEILSDLSEQTRADASISRWDYLMTQFRVITTYIRLIFLPVNQHLDYYYPIYHSLFTPVVLFSFLFIMSIVALGVYLLYRSRLSINRQSFATNLIPYAYYRLIAFGIFWFFITLSVESSIIPISDVTFEHRVYLPSIGMFLAVSSAIFYFSLIKMNSVRSQLSLNPVLLISLGILVIVFSAATYKRNIIWQDEISLWRDVVIKSPDNARGHNNLGVAYWSKSGIDKAIEYYETAIRLKPNYADAHSNLGIAYQDKGLPDKAIDYYQIAIRLKPDYAEAYYNLGNIYREKDLPYKAIEHYQAAIRLKPDYADAYYNLGVVYENEELNDKATEYFSAARKLSPELK